MPINKKKDKAIFFYQRGKYIKAKELCLSVCKKDERDVESHQILANIYLELKDYKSAINYFNAVLNLEANSIASYCGLGKSYIKLNNISKAELYFQKALKLRSDSFDANIGLSDILISRQEYPQAKKILNSILRHKPDSLEALSRLADINFKSGQYEASARDYKKILSLSPDHAQANYHLALIMKINGEIERAIDYLKKAVQNNKSFYLAYYELGNMLLILDIADKAKLAFEKAVKLKPDSYDAISGLALALERKGSYKEAFNLIKIPIDKGIQHAGIANAFGRICKKIEKCEEAIAYMEDSLREADCTKNSQIEIHHTLGKLYDKSSAYDAAFEHYKQANDLRPDTFSAIEFKLMIDGYIELFSQASVSKPPESKVVSDKPIFIIGMPRSGTSLVEQILSAHDDVFGAGELRFIGTEVHRMSKQIDSKLPYPQCFQDLNDIMLRDVANSYLEHINRLSSGQRHVTDKMPHNFIYLKIISLLFPEAHIIHCKRNPKDICLSIYFQSFHDSHSYATRLENIATYYQQYERLMNHYTVSLGIPIFNVQYEELVSHQEEVTRGLLNYLNLEWDERCLTYYQQDRRVSTSSYDQATKAIYSSSIERWRNYEKYVADLFDRSGI